MTLEHKPLAGQVALVAGATRGAGRGIARALGEAGAFVYCTGRSSPGHPEGMGRPETIDETAARRSGAWRRDFAAHGTTLHQADCLIAAAAWQHRARDRSGNLRPACRKPG